MQTDPFIRIEVREESRDMTARPRDSRRWSLGRKRCAAGFLFTTAGAYLISRGAAGIGAAVLLSGVLMISVGLRGTYR